VRQVSVRRRAISSWRTAGRATSVNCRTPSSERLILADGELISAAHLGIVARAPTAAVSLSGPAAVPSPPPVIQSLAEVEKQSILEALRRAKGNKSRTAVALGLGRTQLYTRLRRFGLLS